MIKRKALVYNTALLTASSILMSCIGMAFQVWLVGRIGASGIGLYQLIISVMNLGATFAISGIRFASTRLISEELGAENTEAISCAMRHCLGYALMFGCAAAAILRLLAAPVGIEWIGDGRTVLSLKIAAYSMPCISLCSALSGYFTACGRVWKPTLVHLFEQLFGIFLVALFLKYSPAGDIEKSCAAVTLGRCAADWVSLILMLLVYYHDRVKHYSGTDGGCDLTGRMLKIALPLAVSAYARSALSTIQHIMVPRGLKAAGYSPDGALSGYGIIQGMVLPIVLFPSCIMAAAAEMIVPELTRSQVRNDKEGIADAGYTLIRLSLIFSGTVALVIFILADMLGVTVYKSTEAGGYIRLLAPLIPVMYTDMAVDGCLKGLGEQVWSMGINIIDSLTSLLLVLWLLPVGAIRAYIGIIYFTEILNFVLSALRLRHVMKRGGLKE